MDIALAGYYAGRDDAFWERPQTWARGRALGRKSPFIPADQAGAQQ
jgi:hypothetical protein